MNIKSLATICLTVFTLLISIDPVRADVTVAVDPNTQYQTIRGWGCTIPDKWDAEPRHRQQIIDVGVRDLGVNVFRIEPPMGWAPDSKRWE